jgi:hypothetical protein
MTIRGYAGVPGVRGGTRPGVSKRRYLGVRGGTRVPPRTPYMTIRRYAGVPGVRGGTRVLLTGCAGRTPRRAVGVPAHSPREKCDTCEFLPARNATCAHFSPGEIHTYRFLPGRNPKISELSWPVEHLQTACDFSPGEMQHANFSPGNMQHMRISPREKCHMCAFIPRKITPIEFLRKS